MQLCIVYPTITFHYVSSSYASNRLMYMKNVGCRRTLETARIVYIGPCSYIAVQKRWAPLLVSFKCAVPSSMDSALQYSFVTSSVLSVSWTDQLLSYGRRVMYITNKLFVPALKGSSWCADTACCDVAVSMCRLQLLAVLHVLFKILRWFGL